MEMVALSPRHIGQRQPLARLVRSTPPRLQLIGDDLKQRYVDEQPGPKTSFLPDAARDATGAKTVDETRELTVNEKLIAEIRALQPDELPPAPDREPVDLNGILPRNLLIGAGSYGVFAAAAWAFTGFTGQYFAENPMDSSLYFVQRLSGVARTGLVAMGALGTGVSTIASLGQLALAVQVFIGIQKGELDPNKERIDPYGGRKVGNLEKMFGMMQGNKDA